MAGCSSIANYSSPIHTSRGPCFSNEGFDKTGICPTFRNSDSSLGWVQKIYISDKFSSDADAAGPGPTLRTSDPEHVHKFLVFPKSFKAIISGTLHIIILSLKSAMHISNIKGPKKC